MHRDRLGSWTFVADPGSDGFSGKQQELLDLVLLRWHNAFMSGPGIKGGHVLLDTDHRLVTADLTTQTWLVGQGDALDGLLDQMTRVVAQRFDSITPYEPIELILGYRERSVWIRLTHSRTADDEHGGCYGELRLIPRNEVPTFEHIEDARIARSLGFLDTHYSQNPDLRELADSVELSIYHLHRLFSEHIGMSPKQYLVARQLQVAKWYLGSTNIPVGEVADMAGFSSSGHFSTTFQRLTQVKPVQFRERINKYSD
ncbi:MAG: AraC family transcriptional regulator [Phycisphaeraceae bacterium]|nr:AraC family transcriptional regulator [Phycisphaeraceae bacterium]